MSIRDLVKDCAHRFGYDIVQWSPVHACRRDPYFAQRHLLGADSVQTIFDVGAHMGETAREYLELFPKAHVWSFEPFPDSYRQLARVLEGRPRAHPQQLAVADKPGTLTLNVNSYSVTNSLLPTLVESASAAGMQGMMGTQKKVDVQTTTIDEFCAANSIDHIDILKIDVQGVADKVIAGAAGMFARKRVRSIYMEINFVQLYQGEPCFPDIQRLLEPLGFTLFYLYGLENPKGRLGWGDALFVQPEVLSGLGPEFGLATSWSES